MARPSKKQRYIELLRRHFLPEEARALCKVQSLKYMEIRRMSASRQLVHYHFYKRTGLQPGMRGYKEAYTQYIYSWYDRKKLTTLNYKMQRTISPWAWFDHVSFRLPDEDRYKANSRRRDHIYPDKTKESPSERARRMRWINDLKVTLKSQPHRAPQLVAQILKLGGQVPPAARRKAGL